MEGLIKSMNKAELDQNGGLKYSDHSFISNLEN